MPLIKAKLAAMYGYEPGSPVRVSQTVSVSDRFFILSAYYVIFYSLSTVLTLLLPVRLMSTLKRSVLHHCLISMLISRFTQISAGIRVPADGASCKTVCSVLASLREELLVSCRFAPTPKLLLKLPVSYPIKILLNLASRRFSPNPDDSFG
jgi:hypothetical protein